jgi:hypothetical protein
MITRREAAEAGVQCRHVYINGWVRLSYAFSEHLQCASLYIGSWGIKIDKMVSASGSLISCRRQRI